MSICWVYVIHCPLVFKKKPLTCSQEHDLILPIICHNPVHHNVSKGVIHSDTCEDRSSSQRVNWVVHQRVKSNKTDHLIWKVFGGLDSWIIRLTGALKNKRKMIPPFLLVLLLLEMFCWIDFKLLRTSFLHISLSMSPSSDKNNNCMTQSNVKHLCILSPNPPPLFYCLP